MTYSYTRVVFRYGHEVSRENCTISAGRVYQEIGQVGELAFYKLINKWNRNGLIGTRQSGLTYVYVCA